MEPDGSLLCLQEPTTSPYPEPNESNPYPHCISLSSTFCLFADVNGHPDLSASTTLVQLLLSTLIHSCTFCYGRQFCHAGQPVKDGFMPFSLLQTAKYTLQHVAHRWRTCSAAAIFKPHSLSTDELQLNHTHSMTCLTLRCSMIRP
jgi:hypothetical protein